MMLNEKKTSIIVYNTYIQYIDASYNFLLFSQSKSIYKWDISGEIRALFPFLLLSFYASSIITQRMQFQQSSLLAFFLFVILL